MAALRLSILSGIVENALELFQATASKLRFFKHFFLDLASLASLAPAPNIATDNPNENSMTQGRHQSTCKAGKRTIARLRKLNGVKAVIIGRSTGGKSLHEAKDGSIKLQTSTSSSIKAVMQTSKGVQEITILLEHQVEVEAMRQLIASL